MLMLYIIEETIEISGAVTFPVKQQTDPDFG